MMRRREFITLLGGPVAVAGAGEQQVERMRHIAVLLPATADNPVFQSWVAAFFQGLALLGWRRTAARPPGQLREVITQRPGDSPFHRPTSCVGRWCAILVFKCCDPDRTSQFSVTLIGERSHRETLIAPSHIEGRPLLWRHRARNRDGPRQTVVGGRTRAPVGLPEPLLRQQSRPPP
jgi:hypothetical protein